MNDQIEATESLSKDLVLTINSPVGLAVSFLAIYGAKALTSDVRRAVKRFRENQKADKADPKVETAPEA